MERQWMTLDQIKVEYTSNDYNPELLLQHLLRHVEASPASVPEGWKLVPVEATKKMCGAAYSDRMVWNGGPRAIYEAMLAAAPTPPVSEDRKDADRYRWLCNVATEAQWVEFGGYTNKTHISNAIDAAMEDKP